MNIKDISNISLDEFLSMDKKELSKAVTILGSAINKRVRRFEKRGIETPATRGLASSGGKISSKNKSLNKLRSEFMRAKTYLNAKTGSFKGYKAYRQNYLDRLGIKSIESNQEKFMWKVYNRLEELRPTIRGPRGDSTRNQQRLIEEIISNGNNGEDFDAENEEQVSKYVNEALKYLMRDYETQESLNNVDMSSFFSAGENR